MVLSTQREPFLKRKEWFCPHRENLSLREKNGSVQSTQREPFLKGKNGSAHTERTVH
jgi:hypothetical protein